jgi:hypothetical protein
MVNRKRDEIIVMLAFIPQKKNGIKASETIAPNAMPAAKPKPKPQGYPNPPIPRGGPPNGRRNTLFGDTLSIIPR